MPRTFGDGVIHSSHFDAMVHSDDALPEIKLQPPTDEEDEIGRYIAENLVYDGATLQMGEAYYKFSKISLAFVLLKFKQ